MKKYFVFLIITLFFLSCENSVNHNMGKILTRNGELGDGCVPTNMSGCDGGVNEGVYNWVVSLDEYPNCIFKVAVDYFSCAQGSYLALGLGEFDFHTEGDCDDFEDDMNQALTNNTFDEFAVSFNQQIWSVVTQNLLDDIPQTSPYASVLEMEYVIGSCQKWCYFTKLECGDACCSKTNRYNLNEDKEWVLAVEGDIIRFAGTTCNEMDVFCDPNMLQNESCFDNCESLNF